MAAIRLLMLFAVALVSMTAVCESRPYFGGLVSVDFTGLNEGYSSIGSKGCDILHNALSEDLSSFPEEMNNIKIRQCDWVWSSSSWKTDSSSLMIFLSWRYLQPK